MYALDCPRGVSGFSLSVLLLYVCTASLCLSYFLPGLYYFSMSVTGYMICLWHLTSYLVCIACIRMSPSICSLRLPLPVALTALLYVALCLPWTALVAFLACLLVTVYMIFQFASLVAGFFLPVLLILFLPHVYQCLYDLPGRLLYVALCIDSDCSRGVYGVSVSVLILVPMISDARYVYHTCPVYVSTVGSFRACGFSVRALSTTVFVVPCLNLCLCSPTPAVHLRHWLVYFGNVTLECSCGCRLYLVFPSCALACGDVSVIKCHAPRANLAVGRSWL